MGVGEDDGIDGVEVEGKGEVRIFLVGLLVPPLIKAAFQENPFVSGLEYMHRAGHCSHAA
jgi:hypothetical protein